MKPKNAFRGFVVVCQFSMATISSQAASLTWDSNNTTAPVALDGGGTWTAANNFHNGTANVTWTTGAGVTDTAIFGNIASNPIGVAGAVDWAAGTTVGVGGLVFNPYYGNAAKYNIRGNTATSFIQFNSSPTISVNTNPVRPFAAINAPMLGTTGYDVATTTAGILEIGNQFTASTITGGIRLRNGSTLSIVVDNSLGGTGNGLTFSDASATLIVRGSMTAAAARPITISDGNTARFDTLTGATLTLAPTGGITGVGSTLRKEGLGGLTLASANSYSGQTAVRQGTLTLDFVTAAAATNIINSASALKLYGGTLVATGKASTANSQTFAGLTLDPGASGLSATAGASGSTAINLGAITRNAGSTLNLATIAANTSYATSSANTNGILGGYATVNAADWATVSAGNLAAFTGYQTGTDATLWTSADNVTLAATPTVALAADSTINSMKLTAAATVAIPGANTLVLGTGGLLVTGTGAETISGGTLKGSASGDLAVIQNSTAATTVSSVIANNGGATALTKSGSGSLVLTGANTFSGNVFLNAGSIDANSDAALGAGSTIISRPGTTITLSGGSAITSTKNFAFDFGSESYGGAGLAGTATDTGNFNLNVSNTAGVSLSGTFNVTGGTFVKKGAGMLTLTNGGINQLSRLNGGQGFHVQDGGITFNGGASSEWRVGQAEFVVGTGDNGTSGSAKLATVLVQSGLISVGSWTGICRGDGTVGHQSKIAMTGGTFDTGNLSLGFANGVASYSVKPMLDLSGASIFNIRDTALISESTGAESTINLANTSQFYIRTGIRMATGGSTKVTVNMTGTPAVTTYGDFVLGEADSTTAVLNMAGGSIGVGSLEIAKGGNVAGAAAIPTSAAVNQSGGSVAQTYVLTTNDWRFGGYNGVNDAEAYASYAISNNATLNAGNRNFQIGAYGRGVLDISGTASVSVSAGYPGVGRFPGSIGLMNISGGSFNQTTAGNFLIVAEEGTGTLNVSGGTLNLSNTTTNAGLRVGHVATGVGAFNFNGGTLNALAVSKGNGTGNVYLNGGLLKASGNNATYFAGLSSATVGPNGAKIDSNGFNITVGQSLTAPSGNGITGIGAGTPGTAYIGQPIVQISGGGGTGASAIAIMSGTPATGFTVTGYTITNPGSGYTSAPTVTLVGGGAATAAVPGTATFGAVAADGGLVKSGAGTLTLSGTNTFNGGTVVNAGTLSLGNTGILSATGAVTINDATLDVTAYNQVGALTLNNSSMTGVGPVAATSYAVSNASGTATIAPVLTGTGVNLTKTGAGDLLLQAFNGYTGVTSISGGGTTSLGAAGELDSTSSLSLTSSTFDLRNGSASRYQFINNLTLNSGTIAVGMAGASTDVLQASGTTTVGGSNVIKIYGSATAGSYDVLKTAAPLTGTFTLDTSSVVAGFTSYTGNKVGNNYRVTAAGNPTPNNPYWKGDVSGIWTDVTGAPTNSNWATNSGGGTDTQQLPGGSSDVHFSATGAANTSTTLGADVTINSLSFDTGSASVAGGAKTLTILGGNLSGYPLEVASGASAGMNSTTIYTGTTAIQSGGTLTLSGGNLGAAASEIFVEGALNVNADLTKGILSGAGTIDKTIAGTATFSVGDTSFQTFAGNIKNTIGTLNFTKTGSGQMTLSGTNNSFSGSLKIANGALEITNTGALIAPASLIQQNGSHFINSAGSMNITWPYSFDLNGGIAVGVAETGAGGSGNYALTLASGTTTVSGLITNNGGSVAKRGAGTLVITNPGANVLANSVNVALAIQEGDVVLNGGATATYGVTGEIAVGDNTPNPVTMTLTSGTLNVSQYISVGRGTGSTSLQPALNLNGGTLATQFLFSGYANGVAGYNARPVINVSGSAVTATGTPSVRIGESGGSFGTLNLNSGTFTANNSVQIGWNGKGVATSNMPITVGNLQVGAAAGGVGAFYNNSTITSTLGASTDNFAIGNGTNAYGYFRNNPGASATFAEIGVGGAGGGTTATSGGVLDITGGTVTATAWITPNRSNGTLGQTCLINVTGGTLMTPNSGQFRVSNIANADQHGVINVSGTGAIVGSGALSTMNLNNNTGNDYGMLTIGTGGTVQLTSILSLGDAGHAMVNFNGGTLKAGATAPALLANTVVGYMQAGGGIVDTSGFDATIAAPLVAPSAAGVTGISLSTPGAGYVGRPLVRITDSGGGGVGATAVADFDPVTGAVSGITVTSPGSGYNNPVATLIGGGGTTTAVVGTISVGGAATNGGLTKTGAGTLTLSGLNTYTGNTAVNAGTLTLADDAQLKFLIGANHVNNAITGTATATLNGDFVIDTSGANLTSGNTWTLVNVGTLNETFSPTFSVVGFTETANVWNLTVGANTWSFSEATGVLTLTVSAGYSSWASTYGLGANSEQGDPDNDGIRNLMEYVLGGIPSGAGASNTSILPSQSLDATNLTLTFRRSDISESDTTVKAQWSNDMVSWTDFATVGTTSSLPAVQVTEDSPNADLDTVVVKIPRAGREAAGKLFGRVKASK